MFAHAHRTDFVDDDATVGDAVGMTAVGLRVGQIASAGGFDDFAVSLLHVLRHFDFVVAPLPVEAENGNAPLVDGGGIDFAVAVFVGDHFAAAGEADVGAVFFLTLLL